MKTKIPANEQDNILDLYWQLLGALESRINPRKDILDRELVAAGYRVWNRVTGDTHKPSWEKKAL